jgi:ferredoxin
MRAHMAWRVVVDMDKCESNAVCEAILPEVFEVGEDDMLRILDETPGDDVRGLVEDAIRRCPKQALTIEET